MPCSGRPPRGLARAGAPPDAVGQARATAAGSGALKLPPVIAGSDCDHAAPAIAARKIAVLARAERRRRSRPRRARSRTRAAPCSAGSGEPAAEPELQAPAADQVGRRRLLGHVQRVLVAHVDHGGARSRSARVRAPIAASSGNGDASCRAKWCTRTNAPSIADLLGGLGQLDRLVERVSRGPRPRARRVLPVAEAEEPDPLPHALDARSPRSCGTTASLTSS